MDYIHNIELMFIFEEVIIGLEKCHFGKLMSGIYIQMKKKYIWWECCKMLIGKPT